MKKILSSLFFILAFSILVPLTTSAISENAQNNGNSDQSNQQVNQSSNANASGKLDAAKLKICEKKELKIKNMYNNMNQLGQGQLNLFDNVAEKVKRFYEDNKLVVDNYDEIVAQMEQLREAARNAIQLSTATANGFACDSDNPKDTASQFKNQVSSQVQYLKEYRAAIKSLISAIQLSAEGEE